MKIFNHSVFRHTCRLPDRQLVAARISHHSKMQTEPLGTNIQQNLTHSSFKFKGYKEAVRQLNELQSNAAVLKKAQLDPHKTGLLNLSSSVSYLNRVGVKVEDLDKLNIIHISGTKGKGSTGAFCDSVLKRCGLRTGFYSSPHIIAVRERIRICGESLSEKEFAGYFWDLFNKLSSLQTTKNDMPPYFKFLTIMAFNIFLQEKVDVAIIEVGIGGQYDCTNIIQKPTVCGVTSLGLDHTSILGKTLDKIAWQKAGIFKPGVPVFTVEQKDEAMEVLVSRAKEIGCPLYVAPDLNSYDWQNKTPNLGLAGDVQAVNASLAIQLSLSWLHLKKNGTVMNSPYSNQHNDERNLPVHGHLFSINNSVAAGLKDCIWPGRNEIIKKDKVIFFLDGAHTPESMEICGNWFMQASKNEEFNYSKNTTLIRILIYNSTGDREASQLLTSMLQCKFDHAVFCPNVISLHRETNSDNMNFMITTEQMMSQCEYNRDIWTELTCDNSGKVMKNIDPVSLIINNPKVSIHLFSCIEDVMSWLSKNWGEHCDIHNNTNVHVLVTGSLHLVGGVLTLLTA